MPARVARGLKFAKVCSQRCELIDRVPSVGEAYFLRSERLAFRAWSHTDIELARAIWGDTRVTEFVGGPFTREEVAARLAKEIATMQSDGIQYWPMFLLSDGAHVGCCGSKPYCPPEGTSAAVREIGFYLRPEHWKRGYALEASRAVMQHAFTTLGVHALFAGHHPKNSASRRVLLQLGFQYTEDALYPPTGLMHPSYLLTREQWTS